MVLVNGVERYARCDHRAAGSGAEQRSETAATVCVNMAFRAALSSDERRIHDLILSRRGRGRAIRNREIVDLLWPQSAVLRTYEEQKNCERCVKGTIARLRDEGHYLIAASKEKPYGYFIPETAAERQECHDRMFHEGWEQIRTSQLFIRDHDLAERLCALAEKITTETVRH